MGARTRTTQVVSPQEALQHHRGRCKLSENYRSGVEGSASGLLDRRGHMVRVILNIISDG